MKQNALEGIFPALVLQVPINCLCMMSPTYKGPQGPLEVGAFQLLIAFGDESTYLLS